MAKQDTTMSDRIKALRKEKNLTQLDLAKLLNVTDKAVSKWESSEGNPDISLFPKLSEIFGVTIDYILTGKISEEKVVLMSKAELCAKNDDTALLDELINNPPRPDEKGLTLFDYMFQYSSRKIFRKLSELDKFSELMYKERVSRGQPSNTTNNITLKTSNYGIKSPTLSEIIKMYILSDSLHYLPQIGINRLIDADYFDWDQSLIKLVLSDEIPENSKKIIFNADQAEHGNWTAVYSKISEKAVLNNNNNMADFLIKLIEEINKKTLDCMRDFDKKREPYIIYTNKDNEEIESLKKDANRYANRQLDFLKVYKNSALNNDVYGYNYNPKAVHNLFLVSFSKKTLDHLKENDLVRLNQCNLINKENGGYHFDDKTLKLTQMKVNKSHSEDEIFVFSCMEEELINIEKLVMSDDLNLIKKTLYSTPIHYFEVLKKIIDNKQYKDLFRLSVDIGNKELSYALLQEQYQLLEKMAYDIAKKNDQNPGHQPSSTPKKISIQSQNLEYCMKLIKHNEKTSKGINYSNYRTGNYPYINPETLETFLQNCREAVIKEVSWKIDKDKLVQDLTEDYFVSLLDSANYDLLIIKLCLLLEAKLKVSYKLKGDLNEMLGSYCSQMFFGDDGWGYNVQLDSYTPDILHRLRITRNNIVHSEKTNVKPLNQQEIKDCIIHIIGMN